MALLASRPGDDGETVLRYPAAATGPQVTVLAGSGVTSSWDAGTGDLLLDYTHQGLTGSLVTPAGRAGRCSCWSRTTPPPATFWRLDTEAGPVLVSGPGTGAHRRRCAERCWR